MPPPRKKARLTPSASSIPPTSPAATPISPSASPAPTTTNPTNRPSTPQPYWPLHALTTLFRTLIASKPTGPHKHFHRITIAQSLSSQLGYYIPVPEILAKINELYDIDALDQREQELAFHMKDKRGDWLAEVQEAVFRLPGVVVEGEHRSAAIVEEEEDVDEVGIEELWGSRDGQDAWFVERVWGRRFAESGEEEGEKVEGSPAPSTAASVRRGRPARGTRLSEIKAEEEGDEEQEEEDEEGEEEGTPRAKASTRTSGRFAKRGRKK